MTPVFTVSEQPQVRHTADYAKIDPAFGESSFRKLCAGGGKARHPHPARRSLNHVGQDSLYFDRFGNYGGQGAFANGKINTASPYYSWFTFDASQAAPDKQYKGWVGIADLPELDKSSPDFRKLRLWLARIR
jgi:glycosidase